MFSIAGKRPTKTLWPLFAIERPAWEAGILPLNYSRLPFFSSTYLLLKHLGRSTASLFRLLRPSKTMGFDRKMDSKVDSKPVWEASPLPFSFTVHFTVHPTTDSTYHTGPSLGRTQAPSRGRVGRSAFSPVGIPKRLSPTNTRRTTRGAHSWNLMRSTLLPPRGTLLRRGSTAPFRIALTG